MAYASPPGGAPQGDDGKPKITKNQLLAGGGVVFASVIVLFVALPAVSSGSSSSSGSSPPGQTLPTYPPTWSPTETGSPTPPSTPLPDPSVVLHQGTVTLAQTNGVDLDSTAANWDEQSPATYADDLELAMDGTELHYPPEGAHFVRVDPSAPVAYATCAAATGYVDAFNGPGDGPDQINTRLRFCARTTEGRFAFVQVTSAPFDPNLGVPLLSSIGVKITTWARPANAS